MRTKRFRPVNKLTGPSDYQPVFSSAKKIADSNFLFLFRDNKINNARLGMAISKKNIQSAVQRNKIKRLIRESFRHNLDRLDNIDIVVLTQKSIKFKDSENIKRSLVALWEKLIK